jgi:hypothetical protein
LEGIHFWRRSYYGFSGSAVRAGKKDRGIKALGNGRGGLFLSFICFAFLLAFAALSGFFSEDLLSEDALV